MTRFLPTARKKPWRKKKKQTNKQKQRKRCISKLDNDDDVRHFPQEFA